MEKKHVILLTVIAIATLLITVVGATFAYFAARVEGNKEAKTINIGSAKLAVTIEDSGTLSISNILPGWKKSKDITINYAGTDSGSDPKLSYVIAWDVEDNFSNDEKFLYDIKGGKNGVEGVEEPALVDETDQTIEQASNVKLFDTPQTISAGETHKYTLTLHYDNDPSKDQNQGYTEAESAESYTAKKFQATVKVYAGTSADNLIPVA